MPVVKFLNIKKLIKREGNAIPAFLAHKKTGRNYEESEFIKLIRKYIVEHLDENELIAFSAKISQKGLYTTSKQ